jgi:hypothetical protein
MNNRRGNKGEEKEVRKEKRGKMPLTESQTKHRRMGRQRKKTKITPVTENASK